MPTLTLHPEDTKLRQRHIRTQSDSWVTEKLDYSKTRDHQGYTQIWSSLRDWVYLHRVNAEDALGRWLKRHEQVHHIDGDKKNNAKDNLLIAGQRYHKTLHKRCKRIHGSWHLPS